jgi:alkanesulfonate monooxygenase SsuD/methylene tetrahydromethanopterin reductase-like flavin-dependent oxidoreductase (luciferase family)
VEVGIGLPNAVAETRGPEIVDWARAAEEAGFSSLGTIDRIVFPGHEPLISLAAAAAVTERIRLLTSILLGPVRTNVPLFAKQAASLDNISGGRLRLGLAPGGREDDYQASGVDFGSRGKAFDRQLEELKALWGGDKKGFAEPLTPDPVTEGGPTLILGGSVAATFRRAAKYGAGWMMGGGSPDMFKEALPKLEAAWSDAGRDGAPRKMALAYYSLGPDAEANATRSIGRYYKFLGEDGSKMVAGGAAKSPEEVKERVAGFEAAGCDELVLFPADPGVEQVTLLHEALG